MKLLSVLLLLYSLLVAPRLVLSQELLTRLNELGLNNFATMLSTQDPDLVAEISVRIDVTVWAPSNAQVAETVVGPRIQVTKLPPDPEPSKRQVGEGPVDSPDTNYETIFTFLDNPEFINLGPRQPARFTKNQAAPLSTGADTTSRIEVVSGLGDSRYTIRGPYKFKNGVIYEVSE